MRSPSLAGPPELVDPNENVHKWDVENLKRIFLIIGGLDEKVVQEILDEEETQ